MCVCVCVCVRVRVCACVCVCVHVTTCMLCSDTHTPVLGASVKPVKTAAQMEQLKGTVHVCISSMS